MSRQEAKLVVTISMVVVGVLGVLNLDLLRHAFGYVSGKTTGKTDTQPLKWLPWTPTTFPTTSASGPGSVATPGKPGHV